MTRVALGVGLVATLCVVAAGAAFAVRQSTDSPVAFVDGVAITEAEFDEYQSVLSGEGARSVESWLVIKSLVFQRLALAEAERRGLGATDQDVAKALEELAAAGIADQLPVPGRAPAELKERIRRRILFERVKTLVTENVHPTDDDIRAYVATFRHVVTNTEWTAVRAEVEPAVHRLMVDEAWEHWLARKMACARVEVVMPGVTLPPRAGHATC